MAIKKEVLERIDALCKTLIALAPTRKQMRADAAFDTMFLARELTQIEGEMYRVQYPELEFRRHMPIRNSGLDAAAKYFAYKVWDYFGMAKWISDYADDLPSVGLKAKEVVSTSHPMGDSYQYSADELLKAAMAGIPLEREEAQIAFEAIERLMDQTAWMGDASVNMTGFLKHPSVSILTGPADGAGSLTTFASKTPAQILRDLHEHSQRVVDDSKKIFKPDTFLLPPSVYGLISTKPVSDLQPSTTVLQVFLATSPYIRTVEAGPYFMETANAANTGPRAVLYAKSPRNGEVYIPMEPRQIPPQERNLAIIVDIWAKFGGWQLKQPLSMRYVDGL